MDLGSYLEAEVLVMEVVEVMVDMEVEELVVQVAVEAVVKEETW